MIKNGPPRMEMPITAAMDMPNCAPAVIPSVKGLARGFFRTACITQPHIPRPNPASIPPRIRGKRMFQTTREVRGSTAKLSGQKRAKSAA